jgi:hypothetical protein
MTAVTPEKLAEIASLLERTSPEMAARLLVMFERMKVKGAEAVPAEALLQAIRESGVAVEADRVHRTPGFDRLFWIPFESLLEAPQAGTILPGSLPREGLSACWTIITRDILPDRFRAFDPDVRLASLRGDDAAAESLVGRFRAELLKALDAGTGADLLAACEEAQPVGARLHDLLRAHAAVCAIKAPLMTGLGDLCPDACGELASATIELEAKSEHAAALFTLMLMTRLKRPQQVFRVLRNASHSVNDRKLDNTEFAVLGKRLLAKARRYLAEVEAAAVGRSPFDPGLIADSASALADLATGLEREDILDAHGPWRNDLLAIRKVLAERGTTICQRAIQLCQQVLPLDRVKVKGAGMLDCPRWHSPINAERLAILTAHAGFVSQLRLRASLAGFAAVRDKAERDIRAHVDTIANFLLAMRSRPEQGLDPSDVAAWRDALLALMTALDGVDAAGLFSRRLAA